MLRDAPPVTAAAEFHAWNPGLDSDVPRPLLPLATIFRLEHVCADLDAVEELRDLTGIERRELAIFRPQRLALHELLIRVTADFVVPDGSRIEDLGINFRRIVNRLWLCQVTPQLPAIDICYTQARQRILAAVEHAWAAVSPRWELRDIVRLEQAAAAGRTQTEDEVVRELAHRMLARVMAEIFKKHGCAWGRHETLIGLATDLVCNVYCGDLIGRLLDPLLRAAADQQAHGLLPGQKHPVIINTKGPSASGKSTLRPLQQALAAEVGVNWRDFALISPDIWRKQLLDYSSLGSAYKYAGAFTSDELQIIDQKLDRYMVRKHQRGDMPHLLIDRFRFDSFAVDSDEAGSNLLTRFGQTVHLFFVVTPPEQLVERAWRRGLQFGRYKAVGDTLAHSVEAYAGMPQLFFTWVRRRDKQLQFEFLDNTVVFGERPRTIAFGDNQTMNVLDVSALCNIERYALINVGALEPGSLYAAEGSGLPRQKSFLRQCLREFKAVNFAVRSSGQIYLRVEAGRIAWLDRLPLQAALGDESVADSLSVALPEALDALAPQINSVQLLNGLSLAPTLGQWGTWRS